MFSFSRDCRKLDILCFRVDSSLKLKVLNICFTLYIAVVSYRRFSSKALTDLAFTPEVHSTFYARALYTLKPIIKTIYNFKNNLTVEVGVE